MTVKIEIAGATISVTSPYNSDFVAAAKRLGGRWSAPSWTFDARDEERVRDLCLQTYGDDGRTVDMVTIRVSWGQDARANRAPIELAGRTIARAAGRDTGARLGDGIVLLEGRFGSGGSHRNWATTAAPGTVVLVRDFPRSAADRLIADPPYRHMSISIEDEAPVVDRDALIAERERLTARLAEIDALLGGH